MKLYTFVLLCFLHVNLFGQAIADSTYRAGFTTENRKFSSEGVILEGTLFKPTNPSAAIVLVHGSGQEKRMTELAGLLAKNGIVVFTYDKRGVGKSEGVYVGPEVGTNNIDSSNLQLLALDASAAINTLKANLLINYLPLGLMGFSQAGWVIPLAAAKNSSINFTVLFSGPVTTTLEQLRFQFYTQGNSKFWETHNEADAREHIKNDLDRYPFSATNPITALTKLFIPGLWIFGGKDIQIPVGLSIENLNVLKTQGKNFDCLLFSELGHNTAFSKSQEPVMEAIKWIKKISNSRN